MIRVPLGLNDALLAMRCFADVRAAGVNLAHSYSHYRDAAFASVIHGAKGITWYTYGGFIDPVKKRINYGVCSSAETWHATTNLTRRLAELSPALKAADGRFEDAFEPFAVHVYSQR